MCLGGRLQPAAGGQLEAGDGGAGGDAQLVGRRAGLNRPDPQLAARLVEDQAERMAPFLLVGDERAIALRRVAGRHRALSSEPGGTVFVVVASGGEKEKCGGGKEGICALFDLATDAQGWPGFTLRFARTRAEPCALRASSFVSVASIFERVLLCFPFLIMTVRLICILPHV